MSDENTENKQVNQTTVITPPEDKATKYSKIVERVGFPIAVAAVLLYIQLTVGNSSIELLRSMNEKLTSIDQKLTYMTIPRANTKETAKDIKNN